MVDVKLPWELVEEILYRVHQPRSIIRFKTVCKQWNELFETRWFVNNHLVHARPQFLLWDHSKMYSVNITLNDDPQLEVLELSSEIPLHCLHRFIYCDGLLFCNVGLDNEKPVVLNPWLRQFRWIELANDIFKLHGMGYDSDRPEKRLKIVGSSLRLRITDNGFIRQAYPNVAIFNFETNEWKRKFLNVTVQDGNMKSDYYVSLNGNLYWILADNKTHKYVIRSFDFSKEILREALCILPWDENSYLVLSTFRKDRFSVLKTFIKTDNIEVWVTKNKINIDDGENITWMKFMSFTVPISCCYPYNVPSYFIDDDHKNSLVMCCKDENKKLCIYIVRGNALTKKIHVGLDACHRSYVPSLMSVPS